MSLIVSPSIPPAEPFARTCFQAESSVLYWQSFASKKCFPMTHWYDHFPKRSLSKALPILRSTPALVVGIPVWRATCCLTCVMPNARFHEKLNPGIPVLLPRFAIVYTLYNRLSGTKIEIIFWNTNHLSLDLTSPVNYFQDPFLLYLSNLNTASAVDDLITDMKRKVLIERSLNTASAVDNLICRYEQNGINLKRF